MENKNVTVALAYINQCENPIIVFCNLISYSLIYADKKTLRLDELKNDVKERFGLKLPNHIIKACIKILKDKKFVRITENTTYTLDKTDFNTEKFNEECNIRKIREENLICNLVEYVDKLGKTWTLEEAKSKFTDFLLNDDNAYNLFKYNKVNLKTNRNQISDNWYISNYLTSLSSDSQYYVYLLEIVKGMMIFIGLCQFDNYSQTYNEKFKDTCFFVDTRLLLRYLGYSWKAAVEESQELINLITLEYKGKICIFEHTFNEAQKAIDNEIYALKYGKEENIELKYFRMTNAYNADRFELDSIALRKIINENNNIEIVPSLNWSEETTINNNISWTKLTEYLRTKNSTYNPTALNNDITSINNINVLRKGDYSIRFGGKKKLPIFVTTNYPLINNFKEYVNEYENQSFNYNNTPLIADSTLMYRLWLPKASNASNVPAIKLARTLYAAQQEDTIFYDKLRNKLKLLDGNQVYSIDDIAEKYSRTLFEIVAKNSAGSYENMTDEVVSSSLEELLQITSSQKDELIVKLNTKIHNDSSLISNQRSELIDAYSLRFINKLNLGERFCILFGDFSWVSFIILLVFLNLWFERIQNVNKISSIATAIGVLATIIIKVIDKFVTQRGILGIIKRWFRERAKRMYVKRVQKSLTEKENSFKDEIVDKCIKCTNVFCN